MTDTGVISVDVARYTQSHSQEILLFGMVFIFVFHQDAEPCQKIPHLLSIDLFIDAIYGFDNKNRLAILKYPSYIYIYKL